MSSRSPLPMLLATRRRRPLDAGSPALGVLSCAAALALSAVSARAQSPSGAPEAAETSPAPLRTIDARTRLGGEAVHMPDGTRIGFMGLTELFSVGGDWWFGPGVYG